MENKKIIYTCITALRKMGKTNHVEGERMVLLASANFLERLIRENIDMQNEITRYSGF